MSPLTAVYSERRSSFLVPLAERLKVHLRACCEEYPRIDRITARAKAVDRFTEKAARLENGAPKYSDPLRQIQDQIGARVVTFYASDVAPIHELVLKHLRPIEERAVAPESDSEFGYTGRHYVLLLPTEIVDPESDFIKDGNGFFELQIKTLFEHAWAEAEHDLGYKPRSELNADQRRRIAFTAAQAWGADRIFDELFRECHGLTRL